MEKFKPGDVVVWINQDLGGKVSRVVDQRHVMVELENGLEIEAAIDDITHHAHEDVYEKGTLYTEDYQKNAQNIKPSGKSYFSLLRDGLHLLISEPEGDIYMINNTRHAVFWAMSRVWGGQMKTLYSRQTPVQSFEKAVLTEKTKITRDLSLFIQAVFIAEEPQPLRLPVSYYLTTRSRGETWKEDSPLTGMRLKGKLYHLDAPETVRTEDLLRSMPASKEEEEPVPPPDVDLHIENLTRHHEKMDNAQMLRRQLEVFEQMLEKAIHANYSTITFIHGVGEGVLKTSIIDKLRKHPQVKSWEDAPSKKYGKGATQVWLKKTLTE